MIDGLKWVKDRGRKLGVIGTPNFFVQGKLVKKELAMEDIRAMVDPLIAGRVTASAGAPSPLSVSVGWVERADPTRVAPPVESRFADTDLR